MVCISFLFINLFSFLQLRVFEAYKGKFQTLLSNNQHPIKSIGENDIIIVLAFDVSCVCVFTCVCLCVSMHRTIIYSYIVCIYMYLRVCVCV